MLPTQTLRANLNIRCASVHRPPFVHKPSNKFIGEPMHSLSGMINHFFDDIQSTIWVLEEGQPLMDGIQHIYNEVGLLCDSLALKTQDKRKGDQEYNNVIIKLHKESNHFRSEIQKVMKQIQSLED